MSDRQVIVGWLVVAIVIGICLVDVGLWLAWGDDGTISRTLRAAGERYRLLPMIVAFACGALLDHFFL